MRRLRLAHVVLACAMILPTATCADLLQTPLITAGPLPVVATPVPLSPQFPQTDSVGELAFRGGFELTGRGTGLGGLSALAIDRDGEGFLALSDIGYWLRGRLAFDSAGRLVGVSAMVADQLRDLNGDPVGRDLRDAEALVVTASGIAVVAFEREHRLWAYARGAEGALDGTPTAVTAPPGIELAPDNSGIEGLAQLADGRWIAVAEGLGTREGEQAWVGAGAPPTISWQPFRYRAADGFAVSDLAPLPGGDLVVLERSFTVLDGARARLVHVPADAIAAGATVTGDLLAELSGPMTVDNFEAVAAIPGSDGSITLVIASDDNFRPFQRTLILAFEWMQQ